MENSGCSVEIRVTEDFGLLVDRAAAVSKEAVKFNTYQRLLGLHGMLMLALVSR